MSDRTKAVEALEAGVAPKVSNVKRPPRVRSNSRRWLTRERVTAYATILAITEMALRVLPSSNRFFITARSF